MSLLLNKLAVLKEKGAIEDIDFELCRFLNKMEPNIQDSVLLAACMVSRAYRQGNVCLPIQTVANKQVFTDTFLQNKIKTPVAAEWIKNLNQSKVVGTIDDFVPLVLDEADRLYLQRIWHYEHQLANAILHKIQAKEKQPIDAKKLQEGLDRLFGDAKGEIDWQKVAAATAIHNQFTVISGGPGTGKTTTVVRLLALILEQTVYDKDAPAIALAAPTGKAAKRLQYSIMVAKEGLTVDDQIKAAIPTKAHTIHQLLGARLHSSRFRYNAENPLPYDFIVVDEASMIDQLLMSKLINALLEHTQLVLLGDKDQLASVEAGAVMGDICGDQFPPSFSKSFKQTVGQAGINIPDKNVTAHPASLTDNIILLQKSYRFSKESGIGLLAQAINKGDSQEALAILQNAKYNDVRLQQNGNYSAFIKTVEQNELTHYKTIASLSNKKELFQQSKRSIILSAHRNGPWGSRYINQCIERNLQKNRLIQRDEWYHGKPVMINKNDYNLGLHNGDFGICMATASNGYRVFFEQEDTFIGFSPSQLPEFSTAFAMTVHKSQGSEFEQVLLVLPDSVSAILSRELLYTAVTRTKEQLTIAGNPKIIQQSIKNKLQRYSGLKEALWQPKA